MRDEDWSSTEAFADANTRLEAESVRRRLYHGLSEIIETMLLVPVKLINAGPLEGRRVIIQADEEWTIATLKRAVAVGLPDVADSVPSWRMIYSGRIMDDLVSVGHVAKLVRHLRTSLFSLVIDFVCSMVATRNIAWSAPVAMPPQILQRRPLQRRPHCLFLL